MLVLEELSPAAPARTGHTQLPWLVMATKDEDCLQGVGGRRESIVGGEGWARAG